MIDTYLPMFDIQKKLKVILEENRNILKRLDSDRTKAFVQKVIRQKTDSIFFSAQGRSGFILRCFCMRLMHLGYRVFFCGETITPAICDKDILIVLSGSGETTSSLEAVKSAKRNNSFTIGILGNLDSTISNLVDMAIEIPGTTKLCRKCEPASLQMSGSLFEQSAFIYLETVIFMIYLTKKEKIGKVSSKHTVIE